MIDTNISLTNYLSKQTQQARELEKVKQARLAREHERSMREREKDNEIREMDSARFQGCFC